MDGLRGINGLCPWARFGACLILAHGTILAPRPARAAGTGDAPDPESVREDRDAEVQVVQAPAPRVQPEAPAPPPRVVRPSPPRPLPPELALESRPAAPTVPSPVAGPGLAGLDAFPMVGVPQMLGDQAPISGAPRAAAGSGTNVVRLPWVRGYKMADNQSPLPLDRIFATFYYYDDINVGNARLGATIRDVKVYREFFGFEKTFLDGRSSLGLRLPLNSISARGNAGGSSTSLGDLTVFGKYALWMDRARGVFTLGMAVTPPTGPAAFAGAAFTHARNPTYLQPFIGVLRPFGRWYVQGFSGINVPTDSRVVTMYYNDLGVGYYLHQSRRAEALVSAVVPSMEVHVNTPLNHRGGFSDVRDPGATIDSVNLTFGLSTVLRRRTILSAGSVTPVTGPRPFEIEAVVTLNVFFGGPRTGVVAENPRAARRVIPARSGKSREGDLRFSA